MERCFHCRQISQSKKEVDHLLKASPGWTIAPSGYASYVTSLFADERDYLVVYGLKVVGLSSRRGKEQTLSIRLEQNDVEKFVKRSVEALRQSKEKLNLIMRANIHEVRSINTDIYNAVYRLKENLEQSDYKEDRDHPIVRNIEELSKILRTRTDVLDVLSNPILLTAPRNSIPIYRAFHRVVRSLNSTAIAAGVHMHMTGASVGRVTGIMLFDVIPYLVIQNAIKYAPRGSNIEVGFTEGNNHVVIRVTSEGPLVEEDEIERIFMSGFRGKYARYVTAEGTGFGLYLVKMLVESHEGGTIYFTQAGDRRMVNHIPYRTTNITTTMILDG